MLHDIIPSAARDLTKLVFAGGIRFLAALGMTLLTVFSNSRFFLIVTGVVPVP